MKRSPMPRRLSPLRGGAPLRRTPLKPRSARVDRSYRTIRRQLVADLLAKFPVCVRCHRSASTDAHEPLLRSRGGDPYDPAECIAVCRPCHSWIHDNPKQATVDGWMRGRRAA
jgi:hypothetical protein